MNTVMSEEDQIVHHLGCGGTLEHFDEVKSSFPRYEHSPHKSPIDYTIPACYYCGKCNQMWPQLHG